MVVDSSGMAESVSVHVVHAKQLSFGVFDWILIACFVFVLFMLVTIWITRKTNQ